MSPKTCQLQTSYYTTSISFHEKVCKWKCHPNPNRYSTLILEFFSLPTCDCHIASWGNANILWHYELWPNCQLFGSLKDQSCRTTYIDVKQLHFSWLEKKHAIDSQKLPINSIESLSTWKHNLVISTFAKQHESNELQETTLKISLQRKKETKRSMKQSKRTQKKTKESKKKCAMIRKNEKKEVEKHLWSKGVSATKCYQKTKNNNKLFEHGRKKCNKNETWV